MNIFIRTDASVEIGAGHVMRCLVLAEDLRKRNVNVSFVCRNFPGHLFDFIEEKGFAVFRLPAPENETSPDNHLDWVEGNWKTDVHQTIELLRTQSNIDWFIIDHYAIDEKWENTIRPFVNKIMVIDDLANRYHDCDLLLDQNLYRNMEERYIKLIPKHATALLGIKYLLLRQEFRDLKDIKERSGIVKRILVSFGGSDPTNETMKTLKTLDTVNRPDITVDVVVGFSNQNYSSIKQFCDKKSYIILHCQINYLAELMAKADLAIGAGGSTTWERCYVGLPTMTIETAENQSEILSYLSELGVVCHLGYSKVVTEEDIANNLQNAINSPIMIKKMIGASKCIMKDFEDCSVVKHLIKGE
ncbi:UDP-2,4-diacetamido-2,4,6-trideoxy-beta-L-altropyranose hydrolase [Gracilibacillus sp. YIM 98692]|uniref:UDP-2,4-diacetamido-2,4, 6-trideoxy-beta-L-altropyranose hydrolase n=1 Tax=Gracilibacillus sp. YIM 98692 TaxID=2663532 RepID=UPI0013D17492|nr:UDP-2,4-diacetamido-2,4,6-trideoxy-beta-L-altropyranose hydrolase [Gracilibacillus sp. YIM 98692]